MAECPNCGAQVAEEAKFCSECGHLLQGERPARQKPKRRRWLWIAGGAILLLLAVCVALVVLLGDAEDDAQPTQAARAATATIGEGPTALPAATETPMPTPTVIATAVPTTTPWPTDTPSPTHTATATNTPKPTSTPQPTDTPTPLPEPVVLTGSGDSVVSIEKPSHTCLVHVTGNAAGRHFAVESYDDAGERVDLLVNTTDPYDGYRPLDLMDDENTTRFQVKAADDWTIEVIPLVRQQIAGHILEVPGTFEGSGDNVIVLLGEDPDTAAIRGNASGRFFGVLAYGEHSHLLVNTTDPYEGTVVLARDVFLLEIRAVGLWTIAVQ